MIRTILLAILLPLAAHAQVALFLMNGSTEVSLGDLGKVAAGDTLSVRIRLRNTGTIKVDITRLFTDQKEFVINSAPALPFPIASGSVQDILVNLSAITLGAHSANLQADFFAGTQLASISKNISVTVVAAPVLTVFPACTGPSASLAIDFGLVQSGQRSLCTFYLMNPGAAEMTISTFQITGVNSSSFQMIEGPAAPFKIAGGATAAFVITFTPSSAGSFSSTLTIETRSYTLTGTAFSMPLPTPLLEFDSGPILSAQQRRLTMRLPSAALSSGTGTVKLTLLPDTTLVTSDPSVMFLATGSQTLPFSVTQGSAQISINGQTSAMFQTGTTSGRIRFTLSGIATTGDATTTLTIPAAALSLDSATATRRAANLDIQVTGFDNTYSAGAMTFTFLDTSGGVLPPGAIRADFTQDFRTFFTKTQASLFRATLSFPVTGDTSGIGSVDLQLTNSAGVHLQHLVFH